MTNTTTPTSQAYVPGVCNINPAEVKQRRNAGYLGLAIFIALLALLIGAGLSRWLRLILILPAILAAIGFLQARHRFCVGYAAAGQQHADDSDSAVDIIIAESVAKDKKRAKQLNRQAIVIGVAAGLLTLLIPNLA